MQEANLIRLNPPKSRLHDGPTSTPKPAGSVGGVRTSSRAGVATEELDGLQQLCCNCLWRALNNSNFRILLEQLVKLPLPHQNYRTEGTPVLCPQQANGKYHSKQDRHLQGRGR